MAKQSGPVYITGTAAGICYYKMDGRYYARRKSTLSRKRVKRDPAFALTRKYAKLLGEASGIAAGVYRLLPRAQKKLALYRAMTGQAMAMLKQGADEAEIRQRLQQEAAKQAKTARPPRQVVKTWTKTGGMNVVKTAWRRDGNSMHYGEPAEEPVRTMWTVITRDKKYQVLVPDVRCSSS
jgi:hypothetical protein